MNFIKIFVLDEEACRLLRSEQQVLAEGVHIVCIECLEDFLL